MERLKEDLWKTLQEVEEEEFKKFKWLLGLEGITKAQLENADRKKTVDLMVQIYRDPGAREKANKILKKIGRNDLVMHLENSGSGLRCRQAQGALLDPPPIHQLELEPLPSGSCSRRKVLWFTVIFASAIAGIYAIWAARNVYLEIIRPGAPMERSQGLVKLKWAQQFAKEVTLDPDTAHPHLILSADGKQVHHGDVRQNLQYSHWRFKKCVNVLGKQGFSSGKFYFEVQVGGKTAWTVGVASESIDRKEDVTLCPENGFWTLWLRKGEGYCANDAKPVPLALPQHPKKVGVFVDFEGVVSFYDVDAAVLLYSFTGWSFTEKLYPFFSPCTNDGGINSAPLIITPVKHND